MFNPKIEHWPTDITHINLRKLPQKLEILNFQHFKLVWSSLQEQLLQEQLPEKGEGHGQCDQWTQQSSPLTGTSTSSADSDWNHDYSEALFGVDSTAEHRPGEKCQTVEDNLSGCGSILPCILEHCMNLLPLFFLSWERNVNDIHAPIANSMTFTLWPNNASTSQNTYSSIFEHLSFPLNLLCTSTVKVLHGVQCKKVIWTCVLMNVLHDIKWY